MITFYHKHNKDKDLQDVRGTSVLEILVTSLVSVTIFIIIYVNLQNSSGEVSVSNLAHDVSYGISQAQTYDITGSSPIFINGKPKSYGLHFSMEDKGRYIFFADINGNGIYDSTLGTRGCHKNSECISIWKITKGNFIYDLCVGPYCASKGELDVLSLAFVRPNPEPKVTGYLNEPAKGVIKGYSAVLKISDGRNSMRSVKVEPTGRISIE